ncbi:MAG: hypothetical protein HZB26_16855 [Candidatus Hydrogenedentes bacterium]|nr:hypothetical protein [Candidatus Hydrogenedentota bacterium]
MKPAVLLGMIRGADRIARELQRRAALEIITLYDPASSLLTSAGIPHRRLDDFATEAHRTDLAHRTELHAQAIARQFYKEDFRRQWPQIDAVTWPALRGQLMKFLKRDLLEEMFVVETMRRCVCAADLRLVLVPEDYGRDTRAAILSAQRMGVPALHLLHGYPYQTQNAHDVVSANVTAVYSEHCKAIVESFGAQADQVVVTGNPAWDIYADPPNPGSKQRVCASLKLDPARPIIEYAMTGVHRFSAVSQTHPQYHFAIAEAVIDSFAALSKRHPDWQFVLRPHPIEPIPVERFVERAMTAGLHHLAIDSESSVDIVSAVDVFLCTHSNMGIEALLRGLPVVNVALDAFGGPVFHEGIGPLFLDGDAVLHVRLAEDLAPAVEAALTDPATRERLLEARPDTIRRLNFANDGQAAERLCALALDMIGGNAKYTTPVHRYPEFEPAFAQVVPKDSRSILVVGQAAEHVAWVLQDTLPSAAICLGRTIEMGEAVYDTVVFCDPIPHSARGVEYLARAREVVGDSGSVVTAFRHGASAEALDAFQAGEWAPPKPNGEPPALVGEFSRAGVEIALSRSGLEAASRVAVRALSIETEQINATGGIEDVTVCAWVICARPRPKRLSPYAESRRDRKRRADLSNRIGERRFAKGDINGAVAAFAEAIASWNEEALYFSNLAAAMFSVHELDSAWFRIREALYLDPFMPVVRANYRMIANALDKLEEAEHVLGLFGADEPQSRTN